MAQTLAGSDELQAQLVKVVAADIAQLDALQMVPHAFVGIEVRRIAWQLLQGESSRRASSEKVLDGLSAMDRRAIPDEEDLARDLAEEDAQKAHDRVAVKAVVAYRQEEASVKRHAPHRGEMFRAELDAETRCLTTWRPRGAHVRTACGSK